MSAYFSKFFVPSLPSEQRRGITNSKHGRDEKIHTAWKDLAENNMGLSESTRENVRAEGSRMNELNRLSAIEAKLDALLHWLNEKKSN